MGILPGNRTQHHIWCNYGMGDPNNCKQCDNLYAKCPPNDMNEDEMFKKFYPEAIVIKSLKEKA